MEFTLGLLRRNAARQHELFKWQLLRLFGVARLKDKTDGHVAGRLAHQFSRGPIKAGYYASGLGFSKLIASFIMNFVMALHQRKSDLRVMSKARTADAVECQERPDGRVTIADGTK
jgi:hypothetical protein